MAADDVSRRQYLTKLMAFDRIVSESPRLKYALDHHRNTRGQRMTFGDKPYLLGIFTDPHPEISMMACVQVGKSEMLMVSAFHYAERGLQVMYCLPDDIIRNLFVANRIDVTISKVPYYKSQIRAISERGTDSRGLKHFGKGSIFFAASGASSTFIEKPLDVIIADELDKFDLVNYEKADDRLSASPYKIRYEAANPTVDSYGIAIRYRDSDRRRWWVPCSSCEKWQYLDWFENVIEASGAKATEWRLRDREWSEREIRDIHFFCRFCHKPMNRLADGQWIAEFPSRRVHGYHLTNLMAKHIHIRDLWDKWQKAQGDETKLQVFFNSSLGLPFAGAGSKLNQEILDACKDDYLMPPSADPCVMGVDVGKRLHVTIRQIVAGEQLRLVFAGTVGEFEDLDDLIARYGVITFAIDSMPETRKATDFIKKYPGKGWIVRYQEKLQEVDKNEEDRVLAVDRTQIMDRVLAFYKRKAFINPRNAHLLDKGDFYRLLQAPTRMYNAEKNRFMWVGDPDHYFHAEVYTLLAYIARGEFRVWGLNIGGQPSRDVAPQTKEDLVSRFPPGTDPKLVEHYTRLWELMKDKRPEDTIFGAFEGTLRHG